ncbi:unnamed protein product [Cuscuta campestris]|uniref:Uncharacterized protein n=1 Tax=Cuscuta campestris TaxID=132261 RepID=A0A484LCW6_9ASTE|nr:unnamed protein product [Cuscuta campestris]
MGLGLERRERFSGQRRSHFFYGEAQSGRDIYSAELQGRWRGPGREYRYQKLGWRGDKKEISSFGWRSRTGISYPRPKSRRYLGPFVKGSTILISIESKTFEFKASDTNISISELKNGNIRSLSVSHSTAILLIESLSHPPLARMGWLISRYEGALTTKSHWDSNNYGEFVMLSGGLEMDMSRICIPVGTKNAGINIFIKSMKEALKLRGESEAGDKTETYVRSEEIGSVSITFENDIKELQAQGGNENQLMQSISSDLFEQDIALALREVKITEDVSYTVPEEEMMIQRLFKAAFDAYFDTVFSAVVCQIKEALAKKVVLEKLKTGLVHNMSGKTIRATRETVKGVEKVRMAQIEGSKYPIFISFCRADEQLVSEFLSGDEGEDSPISSV